MMKGQEHFYVITLICNNTRECFNSSTKLKAFSYRQAEFNLDYIPV